MCDCDICNCGKFENKDYDVEIAIHGANETLGNIENAINQCIKIASSQYDNFDNMPTVYTLMDIRDRIREQLKR